MKKKKTFGLFGTNKRRPARRADKKIEEYYDMYEEEEYEPDEYGYDDEDGQYYEDEEYDEEAEYDEDEEYDEDAEYDEDEEHDEEVEYIEEYEDEESQDNAQYAEDSEYEEDSQDVEYEQEEYLQDSEYEDEAYYDEPVEYTDDNYLNNSADTADDDTYDEGYYEEEEQWDDDSYDTGYAAFESGEYPDKMHHKKSFDWEAVLEHLREFFANMTAFDAIIAGTGVVLLVAAIVAGSMVIENKNVDKQIAAIVPVGTELSSVGVVGESGLLAMADAKLNGTTQSSVEVEDVVYSTEDSAEESIKVSVNFESVERDLKIRFTDASTGELITGTAFEVVLTNSKGKQLVLVDEDMDGIIYADNVNPGKFDAIITSTDKYKFPTTAQQITVKDKVEYVVINVQDEVKSEAQVNVATEDTQKADASKEEVTLTDTVEWVESTKNLISGTEGYLPVDKTTIQDPSTSSRLGRSIYLFDGLNVSLNKSSTELLVGSSETLTGTSFTDSKEENDNETIEYSYKTEWTSSNSDVASVEGGKVTAKAAGTATITYTVTKKTVTTTKNSSTEEIEEDITTEQYEALSKDEKAKCTPQKNDAGETTGYKHKKTVTTEKEPTVNETTDPASATCTVTVKPAAITSGSLEISKSADACNVGQTITVKPSKLEYKKSDGSTETKTDNFPTVNWSSSDQAVATVDSNGKVTGVKAGKVTITGQITGVKDADGNELSIKATTDVTINAVAALTLTLDKTEASVGVGKTITLSATVTNHKSDNGVTWESSDKSVATVDEKGVVTGVKVGSAKITATTKEKDASGKNLTATCTVTVTSNAASDTTTKLKDKNGNQIYVKNSDGSYREAVYADYFTASEFYIKTEGQYAYTGWQTINGKTYFYDKSGKVVTGTQIIQGVTYNFGSDGAIQTSVNGSTFGIDVSRHNGKIDWNAVKSSGVDYVIIRCGYRGSSSGALIADQNFQTNIKGATAAGLKVGIYVFSQAINEVEAVKEASLAVSLAKGYKLTYPIFIDTESSGGRADKIDVATRTAVINAFCQTVQSAGYQAGIYASKSWFEQKLSMGSVGNYRIWLAQYAAAPTYSGRYDMWQYSSKGTISGINGKVDLNLSYLGY